VLDTRTQRIVCAIEGAILCTWPPQDKHGRRQLAEDRKRVAHVRNTRSVIVGKEDRAAHVQRAREAQEGLCRGRNLAPLEAPNRRAIEIGPSAQLLLREMAFEAELTKPIPEPTLVGDLSGWRGSGHTGSTAAHVAVIVVVCYVFVYGIDVARGCDVARASIPPRRELARLLRDATLTYSSQGEAARAFGLRPSTLSRALRDGREPLSPIRLLHIAHVSHRDPFELLHAAGFGVVAALLVDLFGESHPRTQIHRLAEQLAALPPKDRHFVALCIEHLHMRHQTLTTVVSSGAALLLG
jgi:hypothetical protein